MPYVLGVDIGGSFTTAATTHYGEGARRLTAQPIRLGGHRSAVPSVVLVQDTGQVIVGDAAEEKGVANPDCVVRDFRQRVGDTVPIAIGELLVAPEDVFGIVARWVVDRAEELEGAAPDAIILTVPATWGDYRLGLVRQALAGVGLADATLLSEPEAAAVNYAHRQPGRVEGAIAVYDLGGNTFDVSIMKPTGAEGFKVMGEPGHVERLGGAEFDELVFRRLALRIGDAFTEHDPVAEHVSEAFSVVRRECVKAKEALSFRAEASVPVILPRLRATVRLVRAEFEAMIDGPVRETITTFKRTLEGAGLTTDDLSAVLLIGGSSGIPFVARQLEKELERPIVVDLDPMNAVSLGAALAGATAATAADSAATQARIGVEAETDERRLTPRGGERADKHPIGPPRWRGFRKSGQAVPVAASAVVVTLVLTVVFAQTTGLSALVSEAGGEYPGVDAGDFFTPEVLRGDGPNPGFPFDLTGPEVQDADAATDVALPPTASGTEHDSSPNRSPSASSAREGMRESAGASSRPPGTRHPLVSTPGPELPSAPATDPAPDPVPEVPPEPAPDPLPDPAPDPDPDPVPDPDPTPADPIPSDPTPEQPAEPPSEPTESGE
jgi:molecular chaperone DnaK